VVDRPRIAIVIAPFAPDAGVIDLGATQKIGLVIMALARAGHEVHLIDSSHTRCGWFRPQRRVAMAVGDCDIQLWRPARLPFRPLGKFLNVIWLHGFDRDLARLRPAVVWVYNSYAYEARLALLIQRRSLSKLVFELEDMPAARRRGFSPKPWIDSQFFGPLLRRATAVTFVNDVLRRRFEKFTASALLLPSILGNDLRPVSVMERFSSNKLTVGYFGGLETEKGADSLLRTVSELPEGCRMVVTGSGTLEDQFRLLSQRYPDRLSFHGKVTRSRLVALMGQCDIIVNPHAPISGMDDGVFPFKVFEGIASGALLISTPLPSVDHSLEGAIIEYDGSAAGLVRAIHSARNYYHLHAEKRTLARICIWDIYGFEAFCQRIRALFT
jgi:glycosyltransferase involved in cell wall biosynthesis